MSANDPHPYPGQPYSTPADPHGPAPYGPPVDDGIRGRAVGALVTNLVLTLLCCQPSAVAGLVLSAMAMSRAYDQPDSARRLVKWAWGLAVSAVVLAVAVLVVLIVASTEEPAFN